MLAVSVPFGAIYNVAAGATAAEGSALAMVIAVGNLVALVLPVVTGSIRDATGGYEGAFMILVGLNTLAIGAAVLITRTHQ
jgi:cyanate permease